MSIWQRIRNWFAEGVGAEPLSMQEIKDLTNQDREEIKRDVLAIIGTEEEKK